jgi:transcriptional regulator with XRE-family HTH domain
MVAVNRGSPTVRRRRLGAELRRLRDAANMTIEQAADRLECSASKISRIETGQIGVSPRDVRDLMGIYGVNEGDAEALIEVAREARQKGWWQPYGAVLTGAYVGFEAAADLIRSYEAQCVPGLLQIEEYAHSMVRAARPGISTEELSDRVRVRMARQSLLIQEDPLDLWVVLDEAVLVRPVGGPAVMRKQLEHLVTQAELPNVTLQVLPFRVGAHSGMEGSFAILHFPEEVDPEMVYVTMATGGVFQEKADEMRRYSLIFDHLRAAALPPEESLELIAGVAREPT